ncbi:MAG: 2OG-Fe(II) oxygenase [Pseudomonadota bacterium]
MSYLEVSDPAYGFFDAERMAEKGRELSARYASASPFPHIVIDDFCTPDILEQCLALFPAEPDPDSISFDRAQERLKTSFNPDHLPAPVRSFFYSLNSRPFLRFLENMTGIDGLIADPHFLGGGFHQTKQGGHLSVHADFNLHAGLKVERRLNLLIYLNHDWKQEYGGALELWDVDMKNCVHRLTPDFNRCVVFSTNANSFHGHPAPINHPEGKPRRSIAIYYYTATWDGVTRGRTTQFKARPRTGDERDWSVRLNEIASDLTPPLVMRGFRKLGRILR